VPKPKFNMPNLFLTFLNPKFLHPNDYYYIQFISKKSGFYVYYFQNV
jgi:hypothetical protein